MFNRPMAAARVGREEGRWPTPQICSVRPLGSGKNRDAEGEHAQLIRDLAEQIIAVHQLVERLASAEFSAAEREKLRRLASRDGVPRVFELANALYRCSGEVARSLIGGARVVSPQI